MKIRVLAPDGRFIPGYGSRAQGEIFELPDELARAYLEAYPEDYETLDEPAPARSKRQREEDEE